MKTHGVIRPHLLSNRPPSLLGLARVLHGHNRPAASGTNLQIPFPRLNQAHGDLLVPVRDRIKLIGVGKKLGVSRPAKEVRGDLMVMATQTAEDNLLGIKVTAVTQTPIGVTKELAVGEVTAASNRTGTTRAFQAPRGLLQMAIVAVVLTVASRLGREATAVGQSQNRLRHPVRSRQKISSVTPTAGVNCPCDKMSSGRLMLKLVQTALFHLNPQISGKIITVLLFGRLAKLKPSVHLVPKVIVLKLGMVLLLILLTQRKDRIVGDRNSILSNPNTSGILVGQTAT